MWSGGTPEGFINFYSFKHNIFMGMPFSSSLQRRFHFCQGDHKYLLESQIGAFGDLFWYFLLLRGRTLHNRT